MTGRKTKKNTQQHGEGGSNAGSKGEGGEGGAAAAAAAGGEQDRHEDAGDSGPNLPAITDQHRELAQLAQLEFEKGNLQMATTVMNKLLAQRNMDPKVLHNKAVVDFYQSGQRNLQEFREKLLMASNMARISDVTDNIEDLDHAVLHYNQAVVLYHWRQYRAALAILEKLYHFIEPIEEPLARKILLLLIELYLCTHEPELCLGVILYTEKMLQNAGKNAAAAQEGASKNEGGGKDTGGKDTGGKDAGGKGSEAGAKGGEAGAKGGDAANKEDPLEQLKPTILQMKVQCLLMMKSVRSCKRELKALSSYGQSPRTAYLKSNFEYLRGNHKKAVKTLESLAVGNSGNPMLSVFYHNNQGCINFLQGKHHLGASYLRRAIEENSRLVKESKEKPEKGKPAPPPVMSHHYELLYNMGIVLLHSGRAEQAFDCLLEAVQVYQVNPLLWHRLAECCITYHRKNNEEDKQLTKRMEVVQESVGSGIHRKLILGTGDGQRPSNSDPSTFPSVKSMGFAALCLTNALELLPEDPKNNSPAGDGEGTDQGKSPEVQLTPMTPANPMKQTEVENLRCSILTASAYVALCNNDPLQALRFSRTLLEQPRLSGAQKYLGHQYMAEALVNLDKVSQAIEHLHISLASDISILPPEPKSDQDKFEKGDKGEQQESSETTRGALQQWYPRDGESAKAIIEYNLGTAHAVRGEMEKAFFFLTESSKHFGMPLPSQLFSLKLYLDLMEGRRTNAQRLLKDYFGHMTPNRPNI